MNSLFRLTAAMILGMGISTQFSLNANTHGHIIYRDHEGMCSELDECDTEEDEEEAHGWYHQDVDDEEEEEDPTDELDEETAWPSRRENFSEMFH